MRKVVVLFMMFFLGLGLTQPGGVMQHCDFATMYDNCSHEDHDITPLDFIFEHLLNLESIVNIIEGEHEHPAGDEHHTPFQVSQAITLIMSVPPAASQFDIAAQAVYFSEKATYFVNRTDAYLSRFSTEMLRPPIC